MTPIRWGILGTGTIAQTFARDLVHADEAVLHAVGSRTDGSARAFAEAHGATSAHGSYEALVADPEVEAIYVATPHTLHLGNASAALRAGKAVLCEKPLTPTPEESRALIAVAEETGSYLLEAMWTHFLPAVQTALSWVREGRIGAVQRLHADFGYPTPFDPGSRLFDPTLAGGALLDLGVYPVALAWLFLEQHPEEIQVTARYAPTGVDDDVAMIFSSPDAVATLGCSFRCRMGNAAVITGDDGWIRIPDFFRAHECSLYRMDERVDHFDDGRESAGYAFEAMAVGDDLRAGRQQSDVVPWASTLAVQDQMARVLAAMERPGASTS
ncbi:MAG: Gfo/Idh/MocA family oxidoreductase [Bacteroidota bacterium]